MQVEYQMHADPLSLCEWTDD